MKLYWRYKKDGKWSWRAVTARDQRIKNLSHPNFLVGKEEEE